jgi:hypothetical protein
MKFLTYRKADRQTQLIWQPDLVYAKDTFSSCKSLNQTKLKFSIITDIFMQKRKLGKDFWLRKLKKSSVETNLNSLFLQIR